MLDTMFICLKCLFKFVCIKNHMKSLSKKTLSLVSQDRFSQYTKTNFGLIIFWTNHCKMKHCMFNSDKLNTWSSLRSSIFKALHMLANMTGTVVWIKSNIEFQEKNFCIVNIISPNDLDRQILQCTNWHKKTKQKNNKSL